jgi:hypothetical protein
MNNETNNKKMVEVEAHRYEMLLNKERAYDSLANIEVYQRELRAANDKIQGLLNTKLQAVSPTRTEPKPSQKAKEKSD